MADEKITKYLLQYEEPPSGWVPVGSRGSLAARTETTVVIRSVHLPDYAITIATLRDILRLIDSGEMPIQPVNTQEASRG